MSIKDIRNNSNGYSLIAIDGDNFFWEEFMGSWFAISECGWRASDADIDAAGIISITTDEEEETIYICLAKAV